MSAELSTRPNLVIYGIVRGVLLGIVLTLFGTLGMAVVAFFTTPGIVEDSELAGYVLFVGPFFACGLAIIPMVIGGLVVGLGLGMFYQQRPRRLTGIIAILIGIVLAVVVFIIGFALVYEFLGGSPLTTAGNVSYETNMEIALWTSPFLLMLMLGFAWLSNTLNNRVPQ